MHINLQYKKQSTGQSCGLLMNIEYHGFPGIFAQKKFLAIFAIFKKLEKPIHPVPVSAELRGCAPALKNR